jgi:osmoprotectant transport system permease protein
VSGLGRVLAAEPLVDWSWVGDHTDDIWANFWEHLQLTALAVGIGFVIALAMALIAVRWRAAYGPLAAFCAALYSVPSLALFAILLPIVGLGFTNALIALAAHPAAEHRDRARRCAPSGARGRGRHGL